jgi:hypothetical protein
LGFSLAGIGEGLDEGLVDLSELVDDVVDV